jgi:hypothetical protein
MKVTKHLRCVFLLLGFAWLPGWGQVAPASPPAVPPAPDSLAEAGGQKVVRKAPESYMVWQVKHVSEFVGRFNHERLPTGEAFTDSTRLLYPREQYLRLLFDEDDPRFHKTNKGTQSLYALQVEEFIRAVSGQQIRIPAQPTVQARVKIRVRHHNRPDTLVVRLQKAYTSDSAAFWQVIGVKAPLYLKDTLRQFCADTVVRADLPPNAQDVGFLPLLRGLNDLQSLCPFAAPEAKPDSGWQRTEAALRRGVLKADAVLSTTIYLPVGNEWQLELNESLLEKENSGWRITNLTPLKPAK